MKQIYFLFLAIIFILNENLIIAQTSVITGLNSPRALVLNGKDLYIAESGGNKISKIDITEASPTLIDVVTGLSSPTALAFKRKQPLFYSESQ
ncbi:hypothetical protein [Tenacibaculum maritimum]|uniref:hypothetical protein n=1 Tax=Tenacibaculum maritimum TaxID=107401 RepID=UPI001E40CE74|nr:hypothetical protein [Tenacibaculum maritimum]MCD9583867.1 hypothetical protein [Tenacibaculum maritimum]MCD9610796.1 hypothetical protein [Tenacibaculum maritimum]MCD9620575.1 hypothetical protein [Tenacibaculum maritimum]MCD9626578.1 hypothetical protein [Tenacibaculum maritimum]MCD9629292.1 hypothetical protein [Tenacibaculum maritimum]